MSPTCHPLSQTWLQGVVDLEECCGTGASPSLPSKTSACSREDFTTTVWARSASSDPSPAALRCRKAASGVGLKRVPCRTQGSKRPRHSRPSFQGQEQLEKWDAADRQK